MPELQGGSFDVFLSHAHVDAELVEVIGAYLEDTAALKVWLDKWILVPGEHWQQEMAKGLDQAKTCAVCIGANTPTGWFREEIERAINRQAKDADFRVIPVILPHGTSSAVDNFLELRTWVDFKNGLDDTGALHLLVSGIRGVAPGRVTMCTVDLGMAQTRAHLQRIRTLRAERLIDDDIALEFQRRLVDQLVTKIGLNQ
jgi:hypothetical protein